MSWTAEYRAAPPEAWEPLAAGEGLFYHDVRWVRGIAEWFGYDVHWVVVSGDGASGIVPLAEVPALLGPRRLVSFPFSYACGPLVTAPAALEPLYRAVRELARERRVGFVEIKRVPGGVVSGYVTLQRYRTYRLDLSGGTEGAWRRAHESVRRGIRKAEREGVRVQACGSVADWLVMARLQEQQSAAHGLPAPPRAFFTEFCRGIQEKGLARLYLATAASEKAPLGGIVIWCGRREWIYAFGASRLAVLSRRPNHALLWQAIQDAAAAGVGFDLGRAALEQRGLVIFKRRWGGHPVPLYYDYWPTPRGLNALPRDRGWLRGAARIWSALPTWITRHASGLYRYMG